ncbi:F0F1 ATP synthase subunit alpha [Patescibacteria group bacterium]|jgi:F-type H+-transporting ATPase subunit alpha|nr:F0F1 ATP synthase subunit alpha [Patescibacteria group bacterium]
MSESLKTFLSALDEALKSVPAEAERSRAGLVESCRDGVVRVSGMPGLRMGEVIRIEDADVDALVMEVDRDGGLAVVLQPSERVREGLAASSDGRFLTLGVGDKLVGRVVDPLGRAVDGKGEVKGTKSAPLETLAPDVMARAPVSEPVQTGILAIDALIPIGRGQRELIIGDRQTGKTTVAIDTILNQKGQDMICVYVAIGQREAKTAQVVRTLEEHGAMDYTVVVDAPASSPAVLQYLAPYAGAAIGEYFMKKGKHALMVFDDLSKHAVAYREVSLLLRKPPGREAYPGDVFYLHSRLLERAAKLSPENGGGSLTALPIIETQAGDISAYIPTNVISITDGQIFLESTLFYRGIRPAINVGASVSRVGGAAQTHIMKKSSGTAKLDLAQYAELAAFSQFASELDAATKKQLVRGERVVEALKQKANRPLALWQEVAVLWAATKGHLDEVPKLQVVGKIEAYLQSFEARFPELVSMIMEKQELSDEAKAGLDKACAELLKK